MEKEEMEMVRAAITNLLIENGFQISAIGNSYVELKDQQRIPDATITGETIINVYEEKGNSGITVEFHAGFYPNTCNLSFKATGYNRENYDYIKELARVFREIVKITEDELFTKDKPKP